MSTKRADGLGSRSQNAQIDHHLQVDNIGIVSDQVARVPVALDESKEDFEINRVMLHEISVSSGSGRALGYELNVEQLRTLAVSARGCDVS